MGGRGRGFVLRQEPRTAINPQRLILPSLLGCILIPVLFGCTRQGGLFSHPEPEPPSINRIDWGRSVFRYETFGNERFWGDVLGLDEGLAHRNITPNALLEIGLQFDGDKLPADFHRSDAGVGYYTDPRATRRLIEANAVLGLVSRGGRIGVTCALCHSRTDDRIVTGVGRRLDGVPNARLQVGTLIAWGERSRAFLPFLNVVGLGRGPRLALDRHPLAAFDDAERVEREVDAALASWPPGQIDVVPDGVGNPTDIPGLFNVVDSGPYNWDGYFEEAADAHNYYFGFLLDPTTLASSEKFLARMARSGGRDSTLPETYHAVLSAIDPTMERPRVAAERIGAGNEEALNGVRVNGDDLAAVTAYLARMLPPPSEETASEEMVAAGRRVFRAAGCGECHVEAGRTKGEVVPLSILKGRFPSTSTEEAVPPTRDDPTGYGDRLIAMSAEWRRDHKGYKIPQLLGLSLTAPYLHDGSIPTLERLFSPERGEVAPHPYYVVDRDERAALIGYLNLWDGRQYP